MALIGGGGAGNVAGSSNPSGVGTSLNYIGNHVYGNSGKVDVAAAEIALIDATTANNSYIVAKIQLGCLVATSDDYGLRIKIDGENVMAVRMSNIGQNYLYGDYPFHLLIPPSSRIEVTLANFASDTAREWYAILEGEVYA